MFIEEKIQWENHIKIHILKMTCSELIISSGGDLDIMLDLGINAEFSV